MALRQVVKPVIRKYAVVHPEIGWFCTDDWGNLFFSDSHPAILYLFESLADARRRFEKHRDRSLLQLYYPVEERGNKLFP